MKRCDSTRRKAATAYSTSAADLGIRLDNWQHSRKADGLAVGVDASQRFIAAARRETQGEDLNVRFEVADVQAANLGDRINLVFSQFGTMFFATPVAALQNVREAWNRPASS